jgi:hypothetical protein
MLNLCGADREGDWQQQGRDADENAAAACWRSSPPRGRHFAFSKSSAPELMQ